VEAPLGIGSFSRKELNPSLAVVFVQVCIYECGIYLLRVLYRISVVCVPSATINCCRFALCLLAIFFTIWLLYLSKLKTTFKVGRFSGIILIHVKSWDAFAQFQLMRFKK